MAFSSTNVERNLIEADLADDGDWFHIDDFPAPHSDASPPALNTKAPTSLAAAVTSGSQIHDTIRPVAGTSQDDLDDKRVDVSGDIDGSSKTKELKGLDGNSLEFPFDVEDDPSEEEEITAQVKPSYEVYDF
ncbi:hypothetical protein SLS60_011916 [Paraconiothyrium brasiliense]|uniref:Uncharacterized protein n=1 Tax=Paraconiothyrium brasiliense TaxID=300254 RepID=A0ABR3QI01_9PLEO